MLLPAVAPPAVLCWDAWCSDGALLLTRDLPALSVAISTRDRAQALARCLESLWRGTSTPAEVVVVDQSTGPETQRLCEQARESGHPVVYLRQTPRGLAASQNLAIARARHSHVAVTDDDCIVDSDWLAVIQDTLTGTESPGVVTGRVLPLEPVGDRVYPVASRTSSEPAEFVGKNVPWPVGSGNNFALKREWFLRIGGCDERLGPGSPGQGGVDMDLFYRLLRAGARIRYEPRAVVHHERDTRAGRLARRPMYGHGMGVCCMLRLREGDAFAARMFVQWMWMRGRLLASGAWRRNWQLVREESLMLRGTLQGVWHGMRDRSVSG